MKAIMSLTGGRAPPSQNSRRLAQDLVGLPKLAVLALQCLQLLRDIRRHASTLAAVDLKLLDPLVQRLRRAADLPRDGHDRCPAR
jgi:hypothetical protein